MPLSTPSPPVEELLRLLSEHGAALSPRERLKVLQVFELRAAWPPRELADALAAVLATNPAELERLRAALASALAMGGVVSAGDNGAHRSERSGALARWWSWKGALAAALLLASCTLAALALLPRPQTVADCAAPGVCTLSPGETRTFEVLENDVAPFFGARRVTLVEGPRHGTATEADGIVTFTAGPELGKDHFVYELRHWSGTARGTVEIEVREVPPQLPDEPPLPAKPEERTRVYFNVPRFAGEPVFIPNAWPPLLPLLWPPAIAGLALGSYALYLRWARRRRVIDPLAWDARSPERFRPSTIGGKPAAWLSPRDLDQLAEVPIYLETEELSERLDAAATVAASARELRPDLRFEARRERLAVLLLRDEDAAALTWNPLPWELVRGLSARGLEVEVLSFHGALPELAPFEERKDQLLVLVVSDGAGLSQKDEANLERLASFPRAAWLDPREPRFWDEQTEVVEGFDLPVFPASREGVTAAFDALLSPRGGEGPRYSVAELRRRGLLVRRRGGLRAQVEEILGDALPWAQSAAMIQPVTVGLAEKLRERFYPSLSRMALGRLFALPGTRVTTAGLTFDDPVLALLREGFPQIHAREKEVAVLEFILEELRQVKPEQDEERPGLALLTWMATYERVRLELEPDEAAKKLERLGETPLGPAMRADLAKLEQPWREASPEPEQILPLRLAPQTEEAKAILADLATPKGGPSSKERRLTRLERAGLGVLAAALLASLWPLAEASWVVGRERELTFVPHDAQAGTAAASEVSRFRFSIEEGGSTVSWRALEGTELTLPVGEEIPPDAPLNLILQSDATRDQIPWQRKGLRAGRVQIPIIRNLVERPCLSEMPLVGLTVQICPESDAGSALAGQLRLPTWREKLNLVEPENRTLSIAIEVDPDPSFVPVAQPLRDALLASSSVDRVYRIDASKLLVDLAVTRIGEDLGPFAADSQVFWWVTGEGEASEGLQAAVADLLVRDRVLGLSIFVRPGPTGLPDPSTAYYAARGTPTEPVRLSDDLEHELRQALKLASGPILGVPNETPLVKVRDLRILSFFPAGGDQLSAWSQAVLTKAATVLAGDGELSIAVVGFARSQGSPEANERRSTQLASAVSERLTSEFGIDARRITVSGRGNADLTLAPGEEVVYLLSGTEDAPPLPPPAERSFTILATSDLVQAPSGVQDGLVVGSFAYFRALLRQFEAQGDAPLVLHAGGAVRPVGDAIRAQAELERAIVLFKLVAGEDRRSNGNLVVGHGLPEVEVLAQLAGRSINRLEVSIAPSQFVWLVAPGSEAEVAVEGIQVVETALRTVSGVRVGVLNLSPPGGRLMAGGAPEQEVVRNQVAALRRQGAEVVVALSYRRFGGDLNLLEALGDAGPDLIFSGGAGEQRIVPRKGRYVVAASAVAGEAAVIKVRLRPGGPPIFEPRLVPLPAEGEAGDINTLAWGVHFKLGERLGAQQAAGRASAAPAIPTAQEGIPPQGAQQEQDAAYCKLRGEAPNCLDEALARSEVPLDATYAALRGGETALGDWIADQMLAAFPKEQPLVAFINAGALRLDRVLPAGTTLTRRNLEELLPFAAPLQVLEISGAELRQVLAHSASLPSGHGGFLQVAGVAFRIQPEDRSVSEVFVNELYGETTIRPGARALPLADDRSYRVVTSGFLTDPGGNQDGYTMLNPKQRIAEGPDLKAVLLEALRRAPGRLIAPRIEGRICIAGSGGPCLLDEAAQTAAE